MTILFLVLVLLLLPRYRLWGPVSPLLFGGPVVLALVWGRSDRDFVLWAGYVTTFLVFVTIRLYADDLGPAPFVGYPIVLDRFLGGGTLPTLRLQHQFYRYGSRSFFDLATIGTHLTFYVAPPLVGLAIWRWRAWLLPVYLKALSLTLLLSLPIHIALPTVPPWMASVMGDLPRVYRIVGDILHGMSPAFYDYGYQVTSGNDVAAMPSTHTALIAVIASAAWSMGSYWRVAGVVYVVAMGTSLVYLGEHYVVDVLVGCLLAGISWKLISAQEARRRSVSAP